MATNYCFDSSVFINSWRRYYPPKIFPTLWDNIFCQLISDNRLFVPIEAIKEIGNGNDELIDWIKANCSNIVDITIKQLETVQEIVTKYPKASDYKKPKPNHADPFVVAVAKLEGYTVVTYEGFGGNADDPKIPFLCKDYGVECIGMIEFFEKEGIRFQNF